jgi:hypothetical protein
MYAVGALFTAVICGVNALTVAQDVFRRGGAYDLRSPALWEGTSGVVIMALLPGIAWAVNRGRATPTWGAAVGIMAASGVTFSALHVLGMVVLRKLAYAALGRSYAFDLLADWPYELRKDVVTFALIAAAFWLAARARPPEQAPVAAGPPAEGAGSELWLRDGASRIRIDAADIVWVASAGNYVEFQLSGRSHLVRGTLTSEESRLAPFGIVRVHRTRLVNLRRVVAVEPRASGDVALRLDTGETVVASRRYRDALGAVTDGPARPA